MVIIGAGVRYEREREREKEREMAGVFPSAEWGRKKFNSHRPSKESRAAPMVRFLTALISIW